ncbi:MAG TPA: V-type ATP synthase subunit E family protein [Gemmatimonadales bacterium]|nr:V-type ATP synthase subunit E family protein [Gemmatimonadales bacterium]
MALDQLLTVLSREAEAEAASVLEASRAEAQAIRDRAAAALAHRKEEEERAWEVERQHAMAITLASSRQRAREAELLARDRMLTRVLTRARQQLPRVEDRDEFRATLPVLLAHSLECLGDRPGAIRCSPALVAEVQRSIADRPAIELRPDPAIGTGFRLTSSDGALLIDATLEQQIDQLAPRLRQEILARLEGAP